VSNRGLTSQSRRFRIYAWSVLAYNILVILWGAVVRATGSGAGCGEHWPLCQGTVIPHAAQLATLIEFAHRATSGLAVALVLGLVLLAFRRFGRRDPVRRYAAAAVFFTLTEGLIGAALVIWGQVGSNASMTRVFVLSLHLVNTLLLLGSLALCARAAGAIAPTQSGGAKMPGQPASRVLSLWYGLGLVGIMAVAVTGTIAALGDTLFPAASLAQGLRWDLYGSPSPLIRLRIIHPVVAATVGVYIVTLALRALRSEHSPMARRLARFLLVLVLVQFALGPLNLLLLAPLWAQILHLLTADLIWLALVLLAAEALEYSQHPAPDDLNPAFACETPSNPT